MPASAARGHGPAIVGAAGMSAGHEPPPAARGCGAAPGLLAGHGPLHAARGHGLVTVAASSLSAGHGPLRATRGCGPATAAGLRWTCGLDSSTDGQR